MGPFGHLGMCGAILPILVWTLALFSGIIPLKTLAGPNGPPPGRVLALIPQLSAKGQGPSMSTDPGRRTWAARQGAAVPG